MPLTNTDAPAEVDAFGIRFLMQAPDGPVRCHIFRAAIDELEESHAPTSVEALRRFDKHRQRLERLASRLYDAGHQTPWIGVHDLLLGVSPEAFDDHD